MRKYYLYGHDGSANHGCEALVKSTCELLNYKKNQIVLVTSRPDEDHQHQLDEYCKIIERGKKQEKVKKDLSFIRAYYALKIKRDYTQMDLLNEMQALDIERNDVALSIGGDSYCYDDKMRKLLFHQHNIFKSKGIKTVLWGCSFEKELLEKEDVIKDLESFDLITARESITYEMLKNVNPNAIITVDSAFLLKEKRLDMPDGFEHADIVGINISPLIEKEERYPGIVRKNTEKLIESILEETSLKILLIPHVVWATNDDRSVLMELLLKYKDSGRVGIIEDHSCEELKGYISRCRFFIGARTHATIAAYSTAVPTLVLGYSTKSKGIAKDLFGKYENYVLPVQELKNEYDLVNSWKWLMENEEACRNRLQQVLPEYTSKINHVIEEVKEL